MSLLAKKGGDDDEPSRKTGCLQEIIQEASVNNDSFTAFAEINKKANVKERLIFKDKRKYSNEGS